MKTPPIERFEQDVPAHMREDVLILLSEAAHNDFGKTEGVTILDRDRYDAINVRVHGIVEVNGEEYTFILEDGNFNGTTLEAWNDDKEFKPLKRTEFALQPQRHLVSKAIAANKGPFLVQKWDIIAAHPEVAEIIRSYVYDRYVQPGCKVEDHYKAKAGKHHFEIVSKEQADETRKRLLKATP